MLGADTFGEVHALAGDDDEHAPRAAWEARPFCESLRSTCSWSGSGPSGSRSSRGRAAALVTSSPRVFPHSPTGTWLGATPIAGASESPPGASTTAYTATPSRASIVRVPGLPFATAELSTSMPGARQPRDSEIIRTSCSSPTAGSPRYGRDLLQRHVEPTPTNEPLAPPPLAPHASPARDSSSAVPPPSPMHMEVTLRCGLLPSPSPRRRYMDQAALLGLEMAKAASRTVITAILPGHSAANQSGLAVGDFVIAVGGGVCPQFCRVPTSGMPLSDVYELIKFQKHQGAGVLTLTIERPLSGGLAGRWTPRPTLPAPGPLYSAASSCAINLASASLGWRGRVARCRQKHGTAGDDLDAMHHGGAMPPPTVDTAEHLEAMLEASHRQRLARLLDAPV